MLILHNIFLSHYTSHYTLYVSDILRLGVIHQRRPSKRLFRHTPPCPTSFVWKTPPPPVRTVSRVKTSEPQNKIYCNLEAQGRVGGVSDSNMDSETLSKKSGRPVCSPPPKTLPVRGRPLLVDPPIGPDVFNGWPPSMLLIHISQ